MLMVLGGGAFGRGLSHKGGALMNEISALIKETPPPNPPSTELPRLLLPLKEAARSWPSVNQKVGPPQTPNPPVP